jgi:hypothetical protein
MELKLRKAQGKEGEILVESLVMEDPTFESASAHVATATFINPKSAGFDYSASLCMGTGWTEMASASFHLNAGESKAIAFPVIMPATPGTYPVYFKVTCGGVLIGTFAATEDVVIAAPSFDLVAGKFTIHSMNGVPFSAIGQETSTVCPTCKGSGRLSYLNPYTGETLTMTCPTCNGTGVVAPYPIGIPYAVLSQPRIVSSLGGETIDFTLEGTYDIDSYYNTLQFYLYYEPEFTTQIAPPVYYGEVSVPISGYYWATPFRRTVAITQLWNAGRMYDGQVKGAFSVRIKPTTYYYNIPSEFRIKGIQLV